MKKIFYLPAIAILLSISPSVMQAQLNCANDSTGYIPLIDLGAGFYDGTWQGGLYDGGFNTPPNSHLNNGLKISKKLKPLDTLGAVNYEDGKIVLAGFGASTVGGPFNHMIQLMKDYTDLNPCMQAVNAANGSDGVNAMVIDSVDYWEYIRIYKLGEKGLTPNQVQVGWLMHSSRIDSNGSDIDSYVDSLVLRFQIAIQAMFYEYPNLKILYISGFPYGGYADPMKALYHVIKEPSSYHQNFAMKEIISEQIHNDPDFKYKGPGKVAPYMVWGPYLWADGVNPRSDGLTWNCEADYAEDGGGYHMTNEGKDKMANILLDFFRTDTISEIWFMDGPKWASCGTGRYADGKPIVPEDKIITQNDFVIYPNPSNGQFYVDFTSSFAGSIDVKVVNNTGAIIYADRFESVEAHEGYTLNLNDQPAGIYHLQLLLNDQMVDQPIVINK